MEKIIKKREDLKITKLIDYDLFCGIDNSAQNFISSITATALKQLQKSEKPFTLIDVREPHERAISHITGSISIPLSTLPNHLNEIPTNQKVILHCQSGQRSQKAIQLILKNKKMQNLYNLEGGIAEFNFE